MVQGKRYRSTQRYLRVWVGNGSSIEFHNHLFPQARQPACTNEKIIAAIESSPSFGIRFKEVQDTEELKIKAGVVENETERQQLERAAKALIAKGFNVNPKLLVQKEEAAEAPQLPAKTIVRSMKKEELQELIEKHGWDIDQEQNVDKIKAAIISEIDAAST